MPDIYLAVGLTLLPLTHLQDSLGGNCQTTVISTISPSGDAFDETVSTLKFADRASNIGNNPIINVSRYLAADIGNSVQIKRLMSSKRSRFCHLDMQGHEFGSGHQGKGDSTTASDAGPGHLVGVQ
jgi:hypothetical protein